MTSKLDVPSTVAQSVRLATVSDFMGPVHAKLEEARSTARSAINSIDAEIQAKTDLHKALTHQSVNVSQAVDLIEREIRASLKSFRPSALRAAGVAVNLMAHCRLQSSGGVVTGDGRHTFQISDPNPPKFASSGDGLVALLAALIDDRAIHAFAMEAAQLAGAPDLGRSVSELAEEANLLASELEDLHERRYAIKRELSTLVQAELSPLVPDSFFQRTGEAAVD